MNHVITIVVLLAVFWPLERLWPARKQAWLRPALTTDALFYLGQAFLFGPLSLLILSTLDQAPAWEVRSLVRSQAGWAQVLELVVLADLSVYWFHRACHRVPLLWRLHWVHHSSEHLDWVAAHREHPIDGLLTQIAINGPPLLLGFPLHLVAPLMVFRGLWAIFIHSNARLPLGPLKYVLGAPELHHWHHAKRNARVKNFANLAPWCDLVFGTFELPPNESYELGVENQRRRSWLGYLLAPFDPSSSARP